MNTLLRILCVEDLLEDAELVERELRKGGLSVELRRVDSEAALRGALTDSEPDVVVCDYALPGWDGLGALAVLREEAPDTPAIMFTGTLPDQQAVACIRAGAVDYVLKGQPGRLPAAVSTALKVRDERRKQARAERALRDSEARYRSLVDSAPDAIVTVDGDGVIQLWNAAAQDIFGLSASEMIGASIQRVVPERFRDSHDGYFSKAVESADGPRRTATMMALRGDGLEFPAEISLSSVRMGGETAFTAVIRDLTEAHSARHAIERLSRQHETLLNSAGEGILGLSPDGSITFANPAALALMGRRAVDVAGDRICVFLEECDAPGAPLCPVLSHLRDGSTFHGEVRFTRSDGTAFPAAVSLTPITEGNRVEGGVLVFEDVTERTEQQRAVRASEASYRSLVDHAPYGIYRSTPEGRFISVNPALVSMLGFDSAQELMALDLNRDLYQRDGERGRLRAGLVGRDGAFCIETVWLTKDGTPLTVRLSGSLVDRSQEDGGAFEVFVEDLTEQRLLEAQLRQAQKMETVGQLTGGIAHDFNNVLAVILLNTELATGALEQGAGVDMEDLRAIQEAAQRASTITRKLLGFSRRADLQVQPTDLAKVVGSLSRMLRTMLPESIDLVVEADGPLPAARVDPGSVEQIILNLASNSRDAVQSGGRVNVVARERDLTEDMCRLRPGLRPGPHIELEVSDDGSGMDEETLSRVFDPFFTTKASGAGTGLGMAMVYGLTRQQGGFVEMESHLGEGTTTRIFFPVCEQEGATAPMADTQVAPARANGTILLVEDEDTVRDVAARALEQTGYRVLSARDGVRALELFAAHRDEIEVVLSDLVLPGINGLQLRARLLELYGPVPFVLTSGYSGDTAVGGGIDPAIPFIRKPWTRNDLLSVVRRVQRAAADATATNSRRS